jgi:hypothetical protein
VTSEHDRLEAARLDDALTALAQARSILAEGTPKAGEHRLPALAYCMLTFGEMLKQASRGTVSPAYGGPIALRDKLAHVPHRKLNAAVIAISVNAPRARSFHSCVPASTISPGSTERAPGPVLS